MMDITRALTMGVSAYHFDIIQIQIFLKFSNIICQIMESIFLLKKNVKGLTKDTLRFSLYPLIYIYRGHLIIFFPRLKMYIKIGIPKLL